MAGELQHLAERVRAKLHGVEVAEKCMFGGITFMLNSNMLCCATNKGLMVRVGKEAELDALLLPHARHVTAQDTRCPVSS